MTVLFDDYITKDNIDRIATMIHCTYSCFNESVMFHKINEFIFDLKFDECWGSSVTLGSSITEYYNVPIGTGLTIKHKLFETSKIIKYIESGINVDISFESTDGLKVVHLYKAGNHVMPNIMECLNRKWIITHYNGIKV